jgi:competence protein ComEA
MVVYVAGRVARPGLYRLASGARADDAVRLAGGMLGDADAVAVNLAAQLSDGDEVAIPALGDSPVRRNRTTPGRRGARVPKHIASPSPSSVDVNAAGAVQLAAVPGIGAAIARRIVAVRDRDGPFDSLDELLDVNGMTASKLDRAGVYLTIGH